MMCGGLSPVKFEPRFFLSGRSSVRTQDASQFLGQKGYRCAEVLLELFFAVIPALRLKDFDNYLQREPRETKK